ncbi:MAG: flavodoxin family protein [Deltaproteobacteria bacterium]|jgi:multimeric flavodoxin WrbA|nr:flavodoxin family protein [Deltaproteobacteria bacterium]
MSSQKSILGLHLSPRGDGSSRVLLDSFANGAREAGSEFRILSVSDHHDIAGCQECGACAVAGQCRIDDGMGDFYEAIGEASRIVVASSIFFYDVPAQGKAVIDRCQAFWSRRYVLGQDREGRQDAKGFLLAVGATKGQDLFAPITLSVKYLFDSLGFPKTFGTLFFRRVEDPDGLTLDQVLSARRAGSDFASG